MVSRAPVWPCRRGGAFPPWRPPPAPAPPGTAASAAGSSSPAAPRRLRAGTQAVTQADPAPHLSGNFSTRLPGLHRHGIFAAELMCLENPHRWPCTAACGGAQCRKGGPCTRTWPGIPPSPSLAPAAPGRFQIKLARFAGAVELHRTHSSLADYSSVLQQGCAGLQLELTRSSGWKHGWMMLFMSCRQTVPVLFASQWRTAGQQHMHRRDFRHRYSRSVNQV